MLLPKAAKFPFINLTLLLVLLLSQNLYYSYEYKYYYIHRAVTKRIESPLDQTPLLEMSIFSSHVKIIKRVIV